MLYANANATLCYISQLRSTEDTFVDFHRVALLSARASQLAAVLLTVLLLKVSPL